MVIVLVVAVVIGLWASSNHVQVDALMPSVLIFAAVIILNAIGKLVA
jgi:hypothetical protein